MSAIKEGHRPAISFVLHAHQPLGYDRFLKINKGIYERSYLASAQLSNYFGNVDLRAESGVSLNVSGSVLLDILAHQDDPVARRVSEEFRQANRRSIEEWGATSLLLQGSIFHSIVPLLPKESQNLQYTWGRELFNYFFGNEPSGVWLPEQAYDSSSLEMIAKSPGSWTVLPQWAAPPSTPTSVPHRVRTSEGNLTVFVYDKYLSDAISWKRAGWEFRNLIKGHNGHDKLAWLLAMDLETFGEHGRNEKEKREGPWQLNNILYHQIPGENYSSLPVQALFSAISQDELDTLSLAKSGSWSCLCKGTKEGLEKALSDRGRLEAYRPYLSELPESLDGILRWTAPCGCTNGGSFDANIWKLPFKSGLSTLVKELHQIYMCSAESLLENPKMALDDYLFIKLKAIDGTLTKDDISRFGERHFRPGKLTALNLLSILEFFEGIYHGEAAQVSCATYWDSPRRIEPGYNILHAGNAVRLFRQAQQHASYGPELENRLSKAAAELEKSIYLTEPQLIHPYQEALAGKYLEHTHLDKMMEKF